MCRRSRGSCDWVTGRAFARPKPWGGCWLAQKALKSRPHYQPYIFLEEVADANTALSVATLSKLVEDYTKLKALTKAAKVSPSAKVKLDKQIERVSQSAVRVWRS